MRFFPAAFTLLFIAPLALASALRAALEFEATEIVLKPALGEKQLTAEFKFKNTGNAPVSVTRVQSGCGCTVPEKPTDPIAPGASGVIPVVYKAGERQGRQMQGVQVETGDGKTHDLRLVVDLPVRVGFAPRLLLFRGADAEAKTAAVTYSADPKTELLGVTSQTAAFEIVGEPMLKDGVVNISIRHAGDAGAEARGTVRVRTRSAGAEHTDLLYVRHIP